MTCPRRSQHSLRDQRRDAIHTGDQNSEQRDEHGEQLANPRLAAFRRSLEDFDDRDRAVLSNGLEESRRAGQALEPRADGGEKSAEADDVAEVPRHLGRHEAAAKRLAEPEGRSNKGR